MAADKAVLEAVEDVGVSRTLTQAAPQWIKDLTKEELAEKERRLKRKIDVRL